MNCSIYFLFVSGSHSLVCSERLKYLFWEDANTPFSSQIPQIQNIHEEAEKNASKPQKKIFQAAENQIV